MRRTAHTVLSALVLIASCALASEEFDPHDPSGSVVRLTDENFDKLTESGTWMVAVTAPWCRHCQELEPTWKALAQQLRGEVHVGKIDGLVETVLAQRFGVEAFPALYHLRNGDTRECHEHRTLDKLTDFAENGWRSVRPVDQWRSPVSPAGRFLGQIRMIPLRVRTYYRYLHHEKGYSILTLLVGFLSIPVITGLMSICLLDSYMTAAARAQQRRLPTAHLHEH